MNIAALILAAGASSRFGGCKVLAKAGDRSMLQSRIDLADAVLPGEVYAVIGAWREQVVQAQARGEIKGATLITNTDWYKGMAGSLIAGVEFLEKNYDGVLVLLADQLDLTPADLRLLLTEFQGENIVCSHYSGSRGVPAVFGKNSFQRIKRLAGDRGAKRLLYETVVPVKVCHLASAAMDIDTEEQLANWKA